MDIPLSQITISTQTQASDCSLSTTSSQVSCAAPNLSVTAYSSQVQQSGPGISSIQPELRYKNVRTIVCHIWNIIAVVAALVVAYVTLEIALWTAAKDYRDDCRGQYEISRNLSQDCERVLNMELSPPLGLDSMTTSGRKRSITEDRSQVINPQTLEQILPGILKCWLIYMCIAAIVTGSIARIGGFAISAFDWINVIYQPGARLVSWGLAPSDVSSPGDYESIVGMSQYSSLSWLPNGLWRPALPHRDGDRPKAKSRAVNQPGSTSETLLGSYSASSHVVLYSPFRQGDTTQHVLSDAVVQIRGGSENLSKKAKLPKTITDVLRNWFLEHLDHPYPSEEEKQIFAQKTGLTIDQITNWFINVRRRQWAAPLQKDRDTRAFLLQAFEDDSDKDRVKRIIRSLAPRS